MNGSTCKTPIYVDNILNHIEKTVKDSNDKQISDEDLVILETLFGPVLQRALDILEKYPSIEKYITTDKLRSLLELQGENDRYYRIFPKINFCSCLAFKHQVLEKKSQLTCKHVLAGRIATILNKTKEHEITHSQYQMLIHSIFDFE